MAVESTSVADLVVQLHLNIDSIHKCVESLADTNAHDEPMQQLEIQREAELEELRIKHENEAQELAAQRAIEQQELSVLRRRERRKLIIQRRREDKEWNEKIMMEEEERLRITSAEDEHRKLELKERENDLHRGVEEKLEQLEDDMERRVEDGKRMLQELDEKRKTINAQIDAALNKSTVIPTIHFRSRAKTLRQPAKTNSDTAVPDTPSVEAKAVEDINGAGSQSNGEVHQATIPDEGALEIIKDAPPTTQPSPKMETQQVSPVETVAEHQAETQTLVKDVSDDLKMDVTPEVNDTTANNEVETPSPNYEQIEPEYEGQHDLGTGLLSQTEKMPKRPSQSIEKSPDKWDIEGPQSAVQAPLVVEEHCEATQEPLEENDLSLERGGQLAIQGETFNDRSSDHDYQASPSEESDNKLHTEACPDNEQALSRGQTPSYDKYPSPTEPISHQDVSIKPEQSPIHGYTPSVEEFVTAENSSVDDESSIVEEFRKYGGSTAQEKVENHIVVEEILDDEELPSPDDSGYCEDSTITTTQVRDMQANEDLSLAQKSIQLGEIGTDISEEHAAERHKIDDQDQSFPPQEVTAATGSKTIMVPAEEPLTGSYDNDFKTGLDQESANPIETECIDASLSNYAPEGVDMHPESLETVPDRPITPVARIDSQANALSVAESPATVLNTDDLFLDDESDATEGVPDAMVDSASNDQPLHSTIGISNDQEQAPKNAAVETHLETSAATLQDVEAALSPSIRSAADHPAPHKGLFASVVSAVKSDVPLVRAMSEGSSGASHEKPSGQVNHRLSYGHVEPKRNILDEIISNDEGLLYQAAPSHPSKYPELHESDISLHIRSHTAETVPSFERYAHSDDADSTPSTPIDEIVGTAQEVLHNEHLISSSWPEGRSYNVDMHEDDHDLKSQASPLQAGFEPYSPRLYGGVITPKSSRVDLNDQESPESMIHSSPEAIEDRELHGSLEAARTFENSAFNNPRPQKFSEEQSYDPHIRHPVLGNAQHPSSLSHLTTQGSTNTIPQANTDTSTKISPSLPTSSIFQRTRSLFESSSAQAVRSIPSAASLSKLVGAGGLKDSIHNPAREEKKPLLGGVDGEGY